MFDLCLIRREVCNGKFPGVRERVSSRRVFLMNSDVSVGFPPSGRIQGHFVYQVTGQGTHSICLLVFSLFTADSYGIGVRIESFHPRKMLCRAGQFLKSRLGKSQYTHPFVKIINTQG